MNCGLAAAVLAEPFVGDGEDLVADGLARRERLVPRARDGAQRAVGAQRWSPPYGLLNINDGVDVVYFLRVGLAQDRAR